MSVNIAIIGSGIGGLALAALASDAGHGVALIERFERPHPVGSGLVIQPVGLAVLARIGAAEAALAQGRPINRMVGHEATTGRRVLSVAYRAKAPGLAIHRAALFQSLWDSVQARGLTVETGATVTDAPEVPCGRMVLAADGRRFGPFDLVVDASGATSRLSPLAARPLAYGALWGTVPWIDDAGFRPDELSQRYLGASRMCGVLPVGTAPGHDGPQTTLFWSLPVAGLPTTPDGPLPEWREAARALWPDCGPFLDQIADLSRMTIARYTHGTLARPYAPRPVFIGDAAHRASPQLGQGANMALLDALALVTALAAEPAEALPAYTALRRWHIRAYQGASSLLTPMYQSGSRLLPLLRDRLLAPLGELPGIRGLLTALVSGDLIPPLGGQRFP